MLPESSEPGRIFRPIGPAAPSTSADSVFVAVPPLKPSEFADICRFARERFGLDLKSGKEELVSARLAKKVREGRFRSFQQYFDSVRCDATGQAVIGFIDALTTNHTSFLREPAHFEFLKASVLGEFERIRPIRIWSAACSTGEEPYSIACSMLAERKAGPGSFRLVATDISSRVLDTARRGSYRATTLAGVPKEWLAQYFTQQGGTSEACFQIRAEVAKHIEFQRMNLIEPTSKVGMFHVIFCRNVMIYFDKPTQQRLVRQLAEQLAPGGYLFVGHSESLAGVDHGLKYVRPAMYRKAGTPEDRR